MEEYIAIIRFFISEIKDLKDENEIKACLLKLQQSDWNTQFYCDLFRILSDKTLSEKIIIENIEKTKFNELKKIIATFIVSLPRAEIVVHHIELINDILHEQLVGKDCHLDSDILEILLNYHHDEEKNPLGDKQNRCNSLIYITQLGAMQYFHSLKDKMKDEKYLIEKDKYLSHILSLLLKKNAYQEVINFQVDSKTALSTAVKAFRPQCVKLLLEYKANPNQIRKDSYVTDRPLLSDVIYGRAVFVKQAAEQKHLPIEIAFLRSLRLLLEYGANIDILDDSGTNVLAQSVIFQYQRLLTFLICAGANPAFEYNVRVETSKNIKPSLQAIKLSQFGTKPTTSTTFDGPKRETTFSYPLNTPEAEMLIEQWKEEALSEKQFQFERPGIINYLKFSLFNSQQSDVVSIINDYGFDELNAPITLKKG